MRAVRRARTCATLAAQLCRTRLLPALLVGAALPAPALDVSFVDVAVEQGLTYVGQSHGASWGDFNADGRPDLFLGNHLNTPAIYLNTGSGFVDIAGATAASLNGDLHGAAWADFDNDGDQDLVVAAGGEFGIGAENNRLLVRSNSGFAERGAAFGIQLGDGRGRTPLWLDWNRDGKLDVLFANLPRIDGAAPTTLFTQAEQSFVADNATAGVMPAGDTHFALLFAATAATDARLLVQNLFPFPAAVYNISSAPFVDEANSLGLFSLPGPVIDVAAGDFDNDQKVELYLTRVSDPDIVRAITPTQVRAFIRGDVAQSRGLSFAATAPVSLSVGPPFAIAADNIYIGAAGQSPAAREFSVDAADPETWGTFAGDPATSGLFVYFDTAQSRWLVQLRDAANVGIVARSDSPLTDLQRINIAQASTALPDIFLKRDSFLYDDRTLSAGLAAPTACPVVVSADFDNDMDLDLYLACADTVGNLANRLLENDGSGSFSDVAGAAGASGTLGGRAESVALADYDSDGFIDILVTNGAGAEPLSADGPTELYRNQGNGNHWLQITLRGIESNAQGIGARVLVEAGGVTQYRLLDGGMHRYSQNHSRLHFGLGQHQTVQNITVIWPSGIVQQVPDQPADQIIQIVEDTLLDSDQDGTIDRIDNCRFTPNPDQRDTNGDGFGNACDADLNGDCAVNVVDFGILRAQFFSTGEDLDADFNGDGIINPVDLGVMRQTFFTAPGPSGLSNCIF